MTNQLTGLVQMYFMKFDLHFLFFRSKPDIKMEASSGRPVDYQVWRETKAAREAGKLNNIPTDNICTALNCQADMLNQWHLSLSSVFCSKPWIYRAVPNKQHRPWASVFQRSLWCLLANCLLHGCCVEQLNCKFVSVLALCNSFKCRKSIYVPCVLCKCFLGFFLIIIFLSLTVRILLEVGNSLLLCFLLH